MDTAIAAHIFGSHKLYYVGSQQERQEDNVQAVELNGDGRGGVLEQGQLPLKSQQWLLSCQPNTLAGFHTHLIPNYSFVLRCTGGLQYCPPLLSLGSFLSWTVFLNLS